MLLGAGGALLACTDHLSIDDIRAYAHTAGELAAPVAFGVGGAVLAVGVLLATLKYLRVMLWSALRNVWLYRRRWASVLADIGLAEEHKTPKLVSVVRIGNQDIVKVRMLHGQSAMAWHDRSAALAGEFGAASAYVRPGGYREIEIVFTRPTNTPLPHREQLALPAPAPHPLPLALPQAQPRLLPGPQRERQGIPRTAIRISGLRLQIVWARVVRTGNNDYRARKPIGRRFGLRGEIRWAEAWATI
jgi:hypothetical protein